MQHRPDARQCRMVRENPTVHESPFWQLCVEGQQAHRITAEGGNRAIFCGNEFLGGFDLLVMAYLVQFRQGF